MSAIYTFSLQQAYAASNEGDGTFGTVLALESTRMMSFGQGLVTDRSEGNSKITYLATQAISTDVQLDTAGFDFTGLEIFTGQAASASNDGNVLEMDNALFPYFALLGQAYPDNGDVLMWLPRCKITKTFSWRFEFGKIVVPTFQCEAIVDPVLGYQWRLLERPSGGAIAFPPQIPV